VIHFKGSQIYSSWKPAQAACHHIKWRKWTNAVLSTGGADIVGFAGDAATCLLADSSWFCSKWTCIQQQITAI